MKVDGIAKAVPVSVAAGRSFEVLDLRIDAFTHGLGDSMLHRVEDSLEVVLEGLGCLLHRSYAGANGPAVPFGPRFFSLLHAKRFPYRHRQLLDGPGACCLQCARLKVRKPRLLLGRQILWIGEPQVAGLLQPIVAL